MASVSVRPAYLASSLQVGGRLRGLDKRYLPSHSTPQPHSQLGLRCRSNTGREAASRACSELGSDCSDVLCRSRTSTRAALKAPGCTAVSGLLDRLRVRTVRREKSPDRTARIWLPLRSTVCGGALPARREAAGTAARRLLDRSSSWRAVPLKALPPTWLIRPSDKYRLFSDVRPEKRLSGSDVSDVDFMVTVSTFRRGRNAAGEMWVRGLLERSSVFRLASPSKARSPRLAILLTLRSSLVRAVSGEKPPSGSTVSSSRPSVSWLSRARPLKRSVLKVVKLLPIMVSVVSSVFLVKTEPLNLVMPQLDSVRVCRFTNLRGERGMKKDY